ncbi:MAG: hypothetical protein KDC12_06350, partial [Flavobacteriales bacterium]|nr:hypothetical protein [Flavobacteriales bacterium]
MRKLLCYLTAVLVLCTVGMGTLFGQLSGVTHELYATDGVPGYNTYRIYAELQDATDFLSAVYAAGNDEVVLGGSGNSIYNDGFGATTGDGLNTGFCMFVPTLCYDSFVTIGWVGGNYWDDATAIACGQATTTIASLPNASVITTAFGAAPSSNLVMQDGSWFTTNLAGCNDNGFGFGANNRVLVAQVTIPSSDDVMYNLNMQIFNEGVGANALFYVGDCQTVNGDDLAGDDGDGVMELDNDGSGLGLSYPALNSCGGVDGCTDSTACNYDSTATNDDGSCTFPGCNDPEANNYDANAGCDGPWLCEFDCLTTCAADITVPFGTDVNDTTITGSPSLSGCPSLDQSLFLFYVDLTDGDGCDMVITRLWFFADCNGCDDPNIGGECTQIITFSCSEGCTDSAACNYDSTAQIDNGSCTYPGCMDSTACNYDMNAGCDSGSCDFSCYGCTDTAACNFDSNASVEDGSCDYSCLGCLDQTACNFDSTATQDDGSCDYSCYGCTDSTACNFDSGATIDDGSCNFNCIGCTDSAACNYDSTATQEDGSCVYPGCTDVNACNFDSTAGCDDNSCSYPGCIDTTACNYDMNAGCADNSCIYPGCMDQAACNYDPSAGCDDGSCSFPGCTDVNACNFDSTAGCDDDSCTYPGCTDGMACNYDMSAGCDDGSCTFPGCTDSTAINYDPNAGCDDDSCQYGVDGCTDVNACNFNSAATNDDGSCTYPGCMDQVACNFDPTAGCDDGSCEYGSGSGFNGTYAAGNWTVVEEGDASVTINDDSMVLVSNDNGTSGLFAQATIVCPANGAYSFDWDYSNFDVDGASYDPAYYINGVLVQLTDDLGADTQSGSVVLNCVSGDEIGFAIQATDGIFGSGILTITNFTYPGACDCSVTCPEGADLECGADTSADALGSPVVQGDCAADVASIEYADSEEGDACAYTITRTWTITYVDGSSEVCEQVINITDTTGPELIGVPADLEVDCLEEVPAQAMIDAEDACNAVVNIGNYSSETGNATDSCTLSTAFGPGDDWAIWLPTLVVDGYASSVSWVFEGDASMIMYDDNTAEINGVIVNSMDANKKFQVTMKFENGMGWDDWSALGRNYKDDLNIADGYYQDWQYYEMV